MCIEVVIYGRGFNCVGMISSEYLWPSLVNFQIQQKLNYWIQNWILISDLLHCYQNSFKDTSYIYSREHLGGVFLNIVKLSLGIGAQIIKSFIYLQLF